MLVGMDVGGTNTDLAVVEDGISSLKVPNTRGIADVLHHVRGPGRLAVSTSTPLNHLLTRRDWKVTSLLIPGPGLRWPGGVKGAVNHCGDIVEEVDREEVTSFLASHPADALAVIGKFSVRNPALEQKVAEYARGFYPDERICLSHPLAVLGFPARVATTRLNASLKEEVFRITKLVESERNTFLFFRGDAGLSPPGDVIRNPSVLTNSSAAAVGLGVSYLTGLRDCLVIDVGGTTTDLVPLESGMPIPEVLVHEGTRTATHVVRAHSLPFGGDSVIRDGLMPWREGNALAFGGSGPTLTDALNRTGFEIGDYHASSGLDRRLAEQVVDEYCRKVAEAVQGFDSPRIAGCGYLAPFLVPEIAREAGRQFSIPPHAECANAIGVAVSRVSLTLVAHFDGVRGRSVVNGEVRRMERMGDEDELVESCRQEVRRQALEAGAHPRDLDEIRVLTCSSYDVVRGAFRRSRITDIVVQVAPGITVEAR
ncbi:MAG: hypothetical protein NQU46_07755 [Methanolinea sp.]|nr:hypothetical protein [Methanolinea sp.]